MKHIVLTDPLAGSDIKPLEAFVRFKEQSERDAERYFPEENRVEVDCPACGVDVARPRFRRGSFQYRECSECRSLFVSPRPAQDALDNYYEHADAGRLREAYFTEETGIARLLHVTQSRADWIADHSERVEHTSLTHLDFGTMSGGLVSELKRLAAFSRFFALDAPTSAHASLVDDGVELDIPPNHSIDIATVFEQLEHRFSPEVLLRRIGKMLRPGGILFATTRTCSGFDTLVLGEKNPYLFVPEHLNLISVEGLRRLFERVGFELIELSTPGQLDVELVMTAILSDPSIPVGDFWNYLLRRRDADTRSDLQAFLQRNRLSSHARITVRLARI
ncbi:MAG: class I SAM-dependent methyltransferase [Dehalococcoidia bacterium]